MDTTRQQKISKLIQKELSEVLQKEGPNIYSSAMVTITRVEVTKDLAYARVYLSIFAVKDKQQVFAAIENKEKDLRFKLGQKVKNQLRVVPALTFVFDDTLDYLENIDKLLKS
ncbi:MAG: 30S ribosome-binding factor RbfA [Bacteroidales bacterium]|nr:30S ribosome-binding factor RbfA [Bacteroidales bacterium]